jgi:2-polyprenyl-3-methyl-5-hydroxy-6-metoxy-1,4-benzoquinol methylase
MRLSKDKPEQEPVMPPAESGGFIPTLNKRGYMTSTLDLYMEAFISYASKSKFPVADIGAAYGISTIPALEKGATVIAVDIDERHLKILRQQVSEALQDRLTTVCAAFPEELDFAASSIGAFLIARVVHFLQPKSLLLAAERLHNWLVPGGKVFLTGRDSLS